MSAVDKPPMVRSFSLPNGSKIVSLHESTLRAGLRAANLALKAETSKARPVRRSERRSTLMNVKDKLRIVTDSIWPVFLIAVICSAGLGWIYFGYWLSGLAKSHCFLP